MTEYYLVCSACGETYELSYEGGKLARAHATASPSNNPLDVTLCEYDYNAPFEIKTEEEAF
jgi:hypothetical protein